MHDTWFTSCQQLFTPRTKSISFNSTVDRINSFTSGKFRQFSWSSQPPWTQSASWRSSLDTCPPHNTQKSPLHSSRYPQTWSQQSIRKKKRKAKKVNYLAKHKKFNNYARNSIYRSLQLKCLPQMFQKSFEIFKLFFAQIKLCCSKDITLLRSPFLS